MGVWSYLEASNYGVELGRISFLDSQKKRGGEIRKIARVALSITTDHRLQNNDAGDAEGIRFTNPALNNDTANGLESGGSGV